ATMAGCATPPQWKRTVLPLLSFALGSAFAARSSRTTSRWPCCAASISGLNLFSSRQSTLTPLASKRLTSFRSPLRAADSRSYSRPVVSWPKSNTIVSMSCAERRMALVGTNRRGGRLRLLFQQGLGRVLDLAVRKVDYTDD